MIPAGVAAAQARISAIESRFAPIARVQEGSPVDFERMLAMARTPATPGSAAATPSAAGARLAASATDPSVVGLVSTTMGPAGAPAELAGYSNGRIPETALAPIGQGQHRLWAPAASAFRAMADAAARDGVTIRVSDSYRSFDEQVALAERKGLYGNGGLAAVPGTSNHGWGRALDLDTSGGTVGWLRANAARFGFHEDVPREPWHWTFRPA